MNTKIYGLILKNLEAAFSLARYRTVKDNLGPNTRIETLPWTPARYRKFKEAIENELHLESGFVGTLAEVTEDFDRRYLTRFFGEIWKPRTDDYNYTGWALAEEINRLDPKSVLDVGCGYNPFKGRIKNLVGIDPYNNCADYMVDILDYKVAAGSHDHIIALGSINFNDREEVERRFAHCVDLLSKGGRFYLRANPGLPHKTGPWVDIFPWTFEIVNEFAIKYNLHLDTFKQENTNPVRLYFVYTKL